MIIAVDFDGTLCASRYPGLGEPVSGAIEAMQALRDKGHYLIIWTCRTGDRLTEAINWLIEHEIPFDRVNDNSPGNVDEWGDNPRKISCALYVDDKVVVGGFPGWQDVLEHVSVLESEFRVSVAEWGERFESAKNIVRYG